MLVTAVALLFVAELPAIAVRLAPRIIDLGTHWLPASKRADRREELRAELDALEGIKIWRPLVALSMLAGCLVLCWRYRGERRAERRAELRLTWYVEFKAQSRPPRHYDVVINDSAMGFSVANNGPGPVADILVTHIEQDAPPRPRRWHFRRRAN
jgi:hypothetical protein